MGTKLADQLRVCQPWKKGASHFSIFTLSNVKQIKYLNRSCGKRDFKGPSGKDYGPMISNKVTNYTIHLSWILARGGFVKNYMVSRPDAKKCYFSFSGWMDVPYVCYFFFVDEFFNTVQPIEMKLKKSNHFNKMKCWLFFWYISAPKHEYFILVFFWLIFYF